MATKRQAAHRKKKRVRIPKSSPFPVPIATLTHVSPKQNYWFYYSGQLTEDHVTVDQSGDIHFLYTMGFFGRGLLSRGAPDLHSSLPNAHIPTQEGSTEVLKVMRRRMYLRHRLWRMTSEPASAGVNVTVPEEMAEFDSDVEYWDNAELNEIPGDSTDYANQVPTGKQTGPMSDSDMEQDGSSDIINEHNTSLGTNAWDNTEENKNFWKTETSWDNTEADEDFWSTKPTKVGVSQNTGSGSDDWDSMKPDTEFWATDDGKTEPDNENKEMLKSEQLSPPSKKIKRDAKGDASCIAETSSDANLGPSKKIKLDARGDSSCISETWGDTNLGPNKHVCDTVKLATGDTDASQSDTNDNQTSASDKCFENQSVIKEPETNSWEIVDLDKTDVSETITADIGNTCQGPVETRTNATSCSNLCNTEDNANRGTTTNVETGLKNACNTSKTEDKTNSGINVDEKENENSELKEEVNTTLEHKGGNYNEDNVGNCEALEPHPYCLEDEEAGRYLVVDDSDFDDRVTNVQIKRKHDWRAVRKTDVFPYREPLILSLEEAFFLSYGLGCLTVWDQSGSAMSLSAMWRDFCARRRGFLPSYVAYHYFRSQGWVPRSGIIFGVDLIVYRAGPPFYHGNYSVIVKTVHEGDYKEVKQYSDRQLTWTSLAGLNRVTEHVAKTLMFCYVVMPKCLTEEDLQSPSCLSKFKVKLQVINRWVSSQEREKENEQEMP